MVLKFSDLQKEPFNTCNLQELIRVILYRCRESLKRYLNLIFYLSMMMFFDKLEIQKKNNKFIAFN